jgi:hypothetical protein
MIEIISASIGAIIALLIWYLSSRDLKKKEKENKQREIRLNYLIEAYQKLESASNRPLTPESIYTKNIESAIADIQLFGTRKQYELIQVFSKTYTDIHNASIDNLLNNLRDDLRSELDLETLPSNRVLFRILKNKH